MDIQQQDFEDLFDMFGHKGWKFFVESVQELHEAMTNAAADQADTNDKWQYARGQLHQLRSIANYEVVMRQAYAQREEQEQQEQEELAGGVDVNSV